MQYQFVSTHRDASSPPRRVVLDTNVAVDIEDFYYGAPRIESRRSDLCELLLELAGRTRSHYEAPDITFGFAISEACWRRGVGPDHGREKRMRRSLEVVTGWTKEEIKKNFNNRHPPANRDNRLKRGSLTSRKVRNPAEFLAARYGSLLYLAHLDQTRHKWKSKGPLWALDDLVNWMTYELGVRSIYEMQLALDLLLGKEERRNGARRMLKLGGREAPDLLADRAWNAAWDIQFLSLTESMTYGLAGSGEVPWRETRLVTRNLDPGFLRMHAQMESIADAGRGRSPGIELDWSNHQSVDNDSVRRILDGHLSPEELWARLEYGPRDAPQRAFGAVRALEAGLGVRNSAVADLLS